MSDDKIEFEDRIMAAQREKALQAELEELRASVPFTKAQLGLIQELLVTPDQTTWRNSKIAAARLEREIERLNTFMLLHGLAEHTINITLK